MTAEEFYIKENNLENDPCFFKILTNAEKDKCAFAEAYHQHRVEAIIKDLDVLKNKDSKIFPLDDIRYLNDRVIENCQELIKTKVK